MRFLILFAFLFINLNLCAQSIRGLILDKTSKQPVQGVHIVSEHNLKESFTDSNGLFKLNVKPGEILIITHLGYTSIEYTIKEFDQNIQIILNPATKTLHDVQINITKNRLTSNLESASIATLSKKQIEENVSRSMAESMIGTPGVWMQKTNHGGGSPFVRGLTGNYVLLLVDGIRMNNSTFRYGPNQYFNTISPFTIQSVEVLRGAGSTLYGSDAIGGTINSFTKDPSFEPNKNMYGTIIGQMMSHQMEYTGALELGGNHKNFAFLTNGSIRNFGDNYAGSGIGYQVPSGYSEKDFMFKGKWLLKNNSDLTFNYQWLRQDDVPRYDQVSQRGYEYYNFTLQQRQITYLKFNKNWSGSALKSLQITASYQESNEERDTKKKEAITKKNERDDVHTLGITSQLDAVLIKKIKLVSGIDFYFDKINSTRKIENILNDEDLIISRGLYPNGATALNTAIYNTYLYNIKSWNLQLGWRYNYTLNKAEDEIFGKLNQSSSSLIGNVSINYQINNKHIYGAFNTAFRAPNINDLSSLGDFDYGIEVPTSELKPERSKNFEVGYKVNTATLKFAFAYYYSHIQDLIDRIPIDPIDNFQFIDEDVYQKTNVGAAFLTGFETDFQYLIFSDLSLSGSLTYTYGENLSKNEPFRRIPPLFGDLSLRYEHNNYYILVQNLAANRQDRLSGGDQDDHRIPDGGTPGWFITNIKTGFKWNTFSFKVALNNIFNQAYRMHGSGVDGFGRHIALSLRYTIQ